MKASELIYQDTFEEVVNPNLDKPMDMESIIKVKNRFEKGRSKALTVVLVMVIGLVALFLDTLTGSLSSTYVWGGRIALGLAIAWFLFDIFMMSGLFNEIDDKCVEELKDIAIEKPQHKELLKQINDMDRPVFYYEYQAVMENHLLIKNS